MEKLLDAVAALVSLVPPEKVQAIATRIRRFGPDKDASSLTGLLGTPIAAGMVDQLVEAWRATTISAAELASMLHAAGHVFAKVANQQSIELVWTGPTTPYVSARRTEQALLQVLHAAEHSLFITSFVAYDVSNIVKALNAASERGVTIKMLLELSKDEGGSISFDVIGMMRALVPKAALYAWQDKDDPFTKGSVHAKVAVADDKMCFVTSANLTGHAMEKNMEAGVLVVGGTLPKLLSNHLNLLVAMNIISTI